MEWSFFGGLSDWEPQIDSVTCKCKSVFCLLFSYYLSNNFLRGLLGRGPQVGLFASEVVCCFRFVKWFFWQFILPSVNWNGFFCQATTRLRTPCVYDCIIFHFMTWRRFVTGGVFIWPYQSLTFDHGVRNRVYWWVKVVFSFAWYHVVWSLLCKEIGAWPCRPS